MVRTSRFTQQMSPNGAAAGEDLFAVLGVNKDATEIEVRSGGHSCKFNPFGFCKADRSVVCNRVILLQIRRAYKTLITKEHPDKGGNPERFKLIKLSYDTLSNKSKVR
jgi:hypothetical protein